MNRCTCSAVYDHGVAQQWRNSSIVRLSNFKGPFYGSFGLHLKGTIAKSIAGSAEWPEQR